MGIERLHKLDAPIPVLEQFTGVFLRNDSDRKWVLLPSLGLVRSLLVAIAHHRDLHQVFQVYIICLLYALLKLRHRGHLEFMVELMRVHQVISELWREEACIFEVSIILAA